MRETLNKLGVVISNAIVFALFLMIVIGVLIAG